MTRTEEITAMSQEAKAEMFRELVVKVFKAAPSKADATCQALDIAIGTYKRYQKGLVPAMALLLLEEWARADQVKTLVSVERGLRSMADRIATSLAQTG